MPRVRRGTDSERVAYGDLWTTPRAPALWMSSGPGPGYFERDRQAVAHGGVGRELGLHRLHHELVGDLRDAVAQTLVGCSCPTPGRERDQHPAHEGQQHAEPDAPQQQQRGDRETAQLGGRRFGQARIGAEGEQRQPGAPHHGRDDQHPLQDPDEAGPQRDLRGTEVRGGHGAVEPVAEVGQPRHRGLADRGDPGLTHPVGDLVGERAHLGVDARLLHSGRLGHGGPRGAGQLLAGGAEVEVEPLERVGLETGEPRSDRPPGGAVGADPGRVLHGLHDGRHARRVGERIVERGDPLGRQRGHLGRAGHRLEPFGGRAHVRTEPGTGRLLLGHALRDLLLQLIDAPAVAGARRGSRARPRGRRPPGVGARRRPCRRDAPRGRCRCG